MTAPILKLQGMETPATSLISLQKILLSPCGVLWFWELVPSKIQGQRPNIYFLSCRYLIISWSHQARNVLLPIHPSVLKLSEDKADRTDCFRRCWQRDRGLKRYSDLGQKATRQGCGGGQVSLGRRGWAGDVVFL